jgi:general secretion pathway protein G
MTLACKDIWMKRAPSRIVSLGLLATVGLMCVHLVSGNVCSLTPRKLRESTLKHDLQVMREAIDNYTFDKQRLPRSLQDLVEAGYLRELPIDPITLKRDWASQIGDIPLNSKGTVNGIYDVHSNSGKSASNGTALNTW